MEQSPTRHRITGAFLIGVACLAAVLIGSQLHTYGVPLGLITPCVLSVLSSALWLLIRVEEAWSSTRHRCSAQGCTFEVRVQNGSAADNRRWQEVAAAHPTHNAV
ncbi:hypothetical protein ABZ468_31415 [Streptomyces sp. NPDC005708]|uniref:hypothetical protein n=1 Tax=Streptomyces sp. NPDC005708 TaxID=3154564 RepID=UPI0033D06D3F